MTTGDEPGATSPCVLVRQPTSDQSAPMRIAILADIHGNLLALEAVLTDLQRRGGADVIVDLGDCASGPLWPCETMTRLKELGATTVRGNHDRQIATLHPSAMSASDRFAFGELTPEQRERLGLLPAALILVPGVLAFHASPASDEVYLIDEIREGRLVRGAMQGITDRLGDVAPGHVVLCGHSHRPDLVRLSNGVLIVNPGSVGCPAYEDPSIPAHVSEAGSPHARYALLHLNEERRPEGAAVEFLALSYANEQAARRAEANGRGEWAFALRTGTMPLVSNE